MWLRATIVHSLQYDTIFSVFFLQLCKHFRNFWMYNSNRFVIAVSPFIFCYFTNKKLIRISISEEYDAIFIFMYVQQFFFNFG